MNFSFPKHDTSVAFIPSPHGDAALAKYLDAKVITGEFGTIFMQQEATGRYAFTRYHFRIRQHVTFHLTVDKPMVVLIYSITGSDIPFWIQGFGEAHLKKDFYHLYYFPAGQHDVILDEGDYTTCQVLLTEEVLMDMQEECADLQEAYTRMKEGSLHGGQFLPMQMTYKTSSLVKGLCKKEHTGFQRRAAINNSISDLLVTYVEQAKGAQKKFKSKYNVDNISDEILIKAQACMDESIHGVAALRKFSVSAGIHYRKLLAALKKKYEKGAKKKRLQRDMEKACMLLSETKMLVLDIALELKYKDSPQFIRAFKNYMGCKPLEYRNKNRN